MMPDLFFPDSGRSSGESPRGQNRSRLARILPLLVLLVLPVAAQSPGTGDGRSNSNQRYQDPEDSNTAINTRMEAKRISALNELRQKSMVSDAGRLLHLAQELQEDANAGGTRMSPVERLRAATEIEKLAKNVKDKMIYAVGAPPQFAAPFSVMQR